MTDLVLHIGLSKCGSTTIQSSLKNYNHYLGRGGADPTGNALTSEFLRLSPINPIPSFGVYRHRAWARRAMDHVSRKSGREPDCCILSSEVLSKPIRSNYEHLYQFLRFIDEKIWIWGKVKVVLVLRNQMSRLGSMFAQRAHSIFNANQELFEIFVSQQLAKDASLNYKSLVAGLNQTIGAENTCVLFLEEIATVSFWNDLYRFSGVQDFSSESIVTDMPSSNRKSVASNTWTIRDACSEEAAAAFANTVLTWCWPANALPSMRSSTKRALIGLNGVYRRQRFSKETSRGDTFELTHRLEIEIKDRVKQGNKELARLVRRNLGSLGYF